MSEKLDRSCNPCRERHIKCSKHIPCENCKRIRITCDRLPTLKFRSNSTWALHLNMADLDTDRRRTSSAFPKDQIWVEPEDRISFVPLDTADDGSEVSGHEDCIPDHESTTDMSLTPREIDHSPERYRTPQPESHTECPPSGSSQGSGSHVDDCQWRHQVSAGEADPELLAPPYQECRDSWNSELYGPVTESPSTSNVSHSRVNNTLEGQSPLGPRRDYTSLFPLNQTDAALVKHFFQTLVIWFDYCDVRHQFATQISERLPQSAPLLYAILAVSSRHLSVTKDYDPIKSDEYHQKCLELLIPQFSEDHIMLKEDILAATVILRLRAELEVPITGFDDQCHLLGTQALLHGYGRIRHLSSFQKAAAWVGLRQEIRIAFLAQSGVSFPLQCFGVDFSLPPKDGGDWANKMVYHLAETLNYACGSDALSMDDYERLVARSVNWMDRRPASFNPIFYQEANGDMRFPRCEYISGAAATGIQHYNLSKILLAFYHPAKQRLRPGHLNVTAQMNAIVESTVRDLCGVGLSNSDCACAVGLACMSITLCRERFPEPEDQKAFADILLLAKQKHAWQV